MKTSAFIPQPSIRGGAEAFVYTHGRSEYLRVAWLRHLVVWTDKKDTFTRIIHSHEFEALCACVPIFKMEIKNSIYL